MKKEKIQYEKSALVLNYDGRTGLLSKSRQKRLHVSEIHSISIERCIERRGIFSYRSERIVIRTQKKSNHIIYYGIKEFDNFQSYKNGLRMFAMEHDISLYDRVNV